MSNTTYTLQVFKSADQAEDPTLVWSRQADWNMAIKISAKYPTVGWVLLATDKYNGRTKTMYFLDGKNVPTIADDVHASHPAIVIYERKQVKYSSYREPLKASELPIWEILTVVNLPVDVAKELVLRTFVVRSDWNTPSFIRASLAGGNDPFIITNEAIGDRKSREIDNETVERHYKDYLETVEYVIKRESMQVVPSGTYISLPYRSLSNVHTAQVDKLDSELIRYCEEQVRYLLQVLQHTSNESARDSITTMITGFSQTIASLNAKNS